MIKQLWIKIKESVASVLPVSMIVLILSLTPLVDLGNNKVTYIVTFAVSAVIMIFGISPFNLGADTAIPVKSIRKYDTFYTPIPGKIMRVVAA